MKNLLITLAVAFGAIPGLTVLSAGVGVPPDKQVLFGAVTQCFGVLALLVLYVNRGKLKRMSKKRITKIAIYTGMGGFIFFVVYFSLISWCVKSSKVSPDWEDHRVYFPLWLSGEVRRFVEISSGRQAALDEAGPLGMEKQLNSMPFGAFAFFITDATLLLLFLAFIVLLTIAFGVPGFHMTDLFERPLDRPPPD